MTDRELLEAAARAAGPLATVGAAAVQEYAAWQERNAARLSLSRWRRDYMDSSGEYFDPGCAENEDIAEHGRLLSARTVAQRRLITARAATRRAIVRAAAEIGRAMK